MHTYIHIQGSHVQRTLQIVHHFRILPYHQKGSIIIQLFISEKLKLFKKKVILRENLIEDIICYTLYGIKSFKHFLLKFHKVIK